MIGEVYDILDRIVSAIKEAERENNGKKEWYDKKLPDFYPTYEESVKLMREIKVHNDYNCFPYKLFAEKAPNESEAEWEYRRRNYQPVTVPYFHKALNVTGRIWNEQNYQIHWDEESEEEQDYFYKKYPEWGNLESFFKQVVTPTTITDPNAVICHLPVDLAYTESGDFDDSKAVTPVAIIFDSERVWAFKSGHYAFIRAYEDVELENNEKGIVLWMFDRNEIIQIQQKGRKSDYQFDLIPYYTHNLDLLPVKRLGGMPMQEGEHFYYQSFFSPVVPSLNTALCDASTLTVSKYAHAFPQRWEYTDECNDCKGTGQIERVVDGRVEPTVYSCPSCNGRGHGQKMSGPLSVYQIPFPNRMSDKGDKTHMEIPPAGYIEQKSDILKFLREEVREEIQAAFELLSIDVMNSEQVSGRETATGKAIDREELYSFLLRFAECVFATFEFSIKCIGELRYGEEFEMPDIRYPQTFEIRTDAELTEELTNAPEFARKMLIGQYLDARFAVGESKTDRIKLAVSLDPLFGKETKDIAALVGAGIVPKWQAALHNSIYYLVDLAFEQNENFGELERAAQRQTLETLAKSIVPETQSLTPESILNRVAQ